MRPIRTIATALLVAGLATAGCGRSQPDQPTPPSQPPVVTTAPTPKTPAPVSAPTPAPTQRPRILSVTTIPPLPKEGGFSVLPAGAGTLTVRVRAVNARRVRFYLTPAGTEMFNENQMIGQDTNGRDGWNLAWRYRDEPLLADITVTAVGANGATSPWVTLGVYHPESAAAPRSVPAPGTIVGLWPVRTLAQARTLQDGADAGHQPWLLSPELVSISYAATELDLFEPVARQVGPAAYKVGPRNSEWVATLYLAQPVRQGAGGIWVITRTGSPAS